MRIGIPFRVGRLFRNSPMGCDMTRGPFSAFSFCVAFFCHLFCALGMEWSILPHLQPNDETCSRGA